MKYLFIIFGLIFLQTTHAQVQEVSGLYTSPFYYWSEPEGEKPSSSQVLDGAQWEKLPGGINFGYNNDTIWVMQNVKAYRAGEWVLQLDFPLIDYLDIYIYRNDELINTIKTGDSRPFSNRTIPVPYFTAGLYNEKPASFIILLRIETKGAMVLPHKWWAEADYAAKLLVEQSVFGAFYGILLMMALYHLFVYLVIREKNYLFFVFTIFTYAIVRMSFDGRGFAWLWPNLPHWNAFIFPVFYSLNQLAVLTFVNSFLDLKNSNAKLHMLNNMLRVVVVFNLVSISFLDYSIQSPLSVMTGTAVTTFGLLSGAFLWWKGYGPARYFTIAWAVFLLGQMLLTLRGFGLTETTWLVTYASVIGALLQVLFFGFSLADRIQTINREKLEAEKALVNNKDKLLHALKRYQDLYENSPIGNFQSNRHYQLTSVNKACATVFGFKDEHEMLSKFVDMRDYLQSDFDDFKKMVYQAIQKSNSTNNELLIKNAQGETRWISINLSYINNEEYVAFEGTVEDITQRKQAEKLKAELDYERINIMEQFSLGIAKEVSVPLGSNVATTSFMREGLEDLRQLEKTRSPSLEDYQHYFELVRSSLNLVGNNQKRITKVVKRFREVSACQQGLKLSHFDVIHAVESVVNSQHWRMAGWRVDIDCDPELSIYSYQSALMAILQQLIDNALTHSHAEKGLAPNIQISVTNEPTGYITIKFGDNGEGIKKGLVSRLCQPFFTTDTGPDGHIGLGLYMIYNLVCISLKGRIFFPVSGEGFLIQIVIPKNLDTK